VTRAALAVALCMVTLAVGLATAVLASRNRARGGDIDRRQRRCETLSRQLELRRADNAREEWLLLGGDRTPIAEGASDHALPQPGLQPGLEH